MGKNKGLCSICGQGAKLTFEHVPPKAAYNQAGVQLSNFDDWLQKDASWKMAGAPQPQGTGMVSLCKACNERTGAWYVPECAKFVAIGIQLHHLREKNSGGDDPDKSVNPRVVRVGIKQIRPLPLLKEIVAMLLAVNGPAFGQANPDLVRFVVNKEARVLPAKYRIFLSMFRGPLARFAGLSVSVSTDTGAITLMTEVAYPPFAYLLTVDSPPTSPVGMITEWANAGWTEVRDVTLDLLVAFGHTPYPGDYRSRAAMDAEMAMNQAALDGADDAGSTSPADRDTTAARRAGSARSAETRCRNLHTDCP